MKQSIAILLAYLTCTDPVMVTKWQNILASFWHKDEGQVVVSITPNGNDIDITLKDGDGNEATTTIAQYQEPANFDISKITGLQTALDAKVDKVTGKQLSTEDFTTALKNKLDGLVNYVHPATHTIGEVDGLQTLLDGLQDQINTLSAAVSDAPRLLDWNGYRWFKTPANTNNYPVVGEELQGRGDGRFENGEWVHCEVTSDDPQDNNDINLFTSYP